MNTVRRRVALITAAVLLVAIAVPTHLLDTAQRARAHEAQRAGLSYAALDLVAVARTEDGGKKLNISRFAAMAPRPNQPISLFIDAKGRELDGDIVESEAFRRQLLAQAESGDNAPVRIGDRLVVVEAIATPQQPDEVFAAAVSYLDARPVDRAVAAASRGRWAAAAGGWVLLTALAVALLSWVLRRPIDAAESERVFLADAAHELKTPWAIVRAQAERATDAGGDGDRLPEVAASSLRSISSTARAAGRTVDDMLILARLDRGVLGEQVRVRIDALLDTCVSEARERHGDELDLTLGSSTPLTVVGDVSLLHHAFTNLVENAVRHGEPPIRVAAERRGSRVRVTVIDSGVGVAPSQRPLIFERFHRASARGGGSGLGLAIVRGIVAAHRGTVTYEDRADQPGAVFVVDLPAA